MDSRRRRPRRCSSRRYKAEGPGRLPAAVVVTARRPEEARRRLERKSRPIFEKNERGGPGWPPFEAASRASRKDAQAPGPAPRTRHGGQRHPSLRHAHISDDGQRRSPKYGRGHQVLYCAKCRYTPNASTVDANARPSQRRADDFSFHSLDHRTSAMQTHSDIHGLLLRAHARDDIPMADGRPPKSLERVRCKRARRLRRAEAFSTGCFAGDILLRELSFRDSK